MTDDIDDDKQVAKAAADPLSGASLMPMLVGGLVLIVLAMVAAAALS